MFLYYLVNIIILAFKR